ncbi:glycosyltransferase family 4 protein [Streptomyces anulatus]|uniref:glycosyltransferase family 4 protein n=1 Tax=Streptomyces anulatus TaxID=1892 RepID=UPI002259120E|nr:glycosyltransferase [Streptomyces anulatus]MCX4504553.1 glycosyltransferase [Streptomyces anulatus]
MKVHFWSADTTGSALYRCVLPGTAMQWAGHTVTVGQALPEAWGTYDVVVGARVANPEASLMWRRMKDAGVQLVLDLDDDYFHIDPAFGHVYQDWTDRGLQTSLAKNIEIADQVTVCSTVLKDVVGNLHPDVRVVPNGLPAGYLGIPRDYRPDLLTVGWAGTATTVLELPLVARHLNRVADYKSGVDALCVGIDTSRSQAAGLRQSVPATGWHPIWEEYAGMVYQFGIWVAPYRDTPFNRAKFATKALEAGFFGIPLIATDLPGYREWITHGVNGYLVPTGQEHLFGRYIKRLVDNPDLRQSMGHAARARASQNILEALGGRWAEALERQGGTHAAR